MRSWRYTNPSLSVLKLIEVDFIGLDDIAEDRESLMAILPDLGSLDSLACKKLLKDILGAMLEGLAVSTEALDLTVLDTVSQKSRNLLRTPWAIDQKETPRSRTTLFLQAPGKDRVGLREEQTIIRAGHNSRIGRLINRKSAIGAKLSKTDYLAVMTGLMELMAREGLVSLVEIEADLHGWRLSPYAVRLIPGEAIRSGTAQGNRYFHDLYSTIAADLKGGQSTYWGLEGREHTAQVSQRQREWREWRFRFEDDDRIKLSENAADIRASGESDQFLPALFCSPTMELGVDISALNAVYLRNVPPTPANYAQRAGRAGRSGQAAVIVTYCAAQSPHDQYFFERRNDMVAGVVRPPALDITNEELVRSHLHAVWLAEAKLALSPDIPEILDLKQVNYPLKQDVLDVISRPGLVKTALAPMKRVLDQILSSMHGKKPVWMADADDFILDVAVRAPKEFDRAFDRWRELYNSARTQLMEANSRSEITGLSGADRRKIKAAQMQASDQIAILEQGKATNGSDFYSYRYLATEGFLPGYNFPRLPLYAFVPGEGKAGSFLQRARFLAISEFGPRSLIYHEGRAYRVVKAKLPPEARTGDGSELATKDIFICSNCGACHEGDVERCHACNSPMAGEVPVQKTLRIDNVEAAPADRITANDEERVRQGFDIQTVFSWPKRNGQLQVTEADFRCGETSILSLQYANSAEISRINKGLKRRKNQTVFGFNIDPRSGYWAKSEDEEPDVDVPPDVIKPIRIVPIVRDRKNALLLRFRNPDAYAPETIATVQHALLRGIAVTFQLEEGGEILGEPLPARNNRRSILAYEATEDGAGVLSRLVEDAHAIGKVAKEALSLMHFDNVDAAIAAGDPGLLVDRDGEACVRGCYRCLLSYFNQPDHEMIDRASNEAKQMLIDLARGEVVLATTASRSPGADGWEPALKDAGIPPPDGTPVIFAEQQMMFAWRSYCVAASPVALSDAAREIADAKGWTLFQLPETSAAGVPDAVDIEPSTGFDTDPALLALVTRAEKLVHQPDPKLTALVDALTPLLKKGANPVVFCRYLATAEHVRNGLRKAFPKLAIEAVTGVLTPDERRNRVADMALANDLKETQRILVATDCLSEGINLQQLFDTVIHYDLSWNPTRHQQREGRVDRFGQPAEVVRSIMMFSPDSAIDGAVLEVILRKAEEIRKATGVTVPLPDNRGPVTDALMASMMLRRGGTRQLALDLRLDDGTKAMESRWRDASESEKKSRARFAQNAMKPQEVAPEWETALYAVMPRVYQLGLTLPDAPLEEFQKAVANLPKTTEAERLIIQRVGQDIFRNGLMTYWRGRCPLTGITDPALLRASHIIAWKDCSTDADRLDVHNGLLLSALWDAAFDRGLVTFDDNGRPAFSPALSEIARAELRWQMAIPITEKHRRRLSWHRKNQFMVQ